MDKLARAICASCLALAAPAAIAANNVFATGPAAAMTKGDFDVAMASLDETLEGAKDGETRAWTSAATGATGKITPRRSFTQDALSCREAHFETRAGGRSGASDWILCKHGTEWKIHGAPPPMKAATGAPAK